jgi:hypothetical protein
MLMISVGGGASSVGVGWGRAVAMVGSGVHVFGADWMETGGDVNRGPGDGTRTQSGRRPV